MDVSHLGDTARARALSPFCHTMGLSALGESLYTCTRSCARFAAIAAPGLRSAV